MGTEDRMLRLLAFGVDAWGFFKDSVMNSFWMVLEFEKCATYYVFFSEFILVSLSVGSCILGSASVPKSIVCILYRFYLLARMEFLTL